MFFGERGREGSLNFLLHESTHIYTDYCYDVLLSYRVVDFLVISAKGNEKKEVKKD